MSTVIIISGKQGSGKTTLQRALRDKLGGVTLNFADCIYLLHAGIQATMQDFFPEITCLRRGIPKDGRLLQLLGTEWGRAFDPDIWVKITKQWAEKYPLVIIGDCRFKNEFNAFPDAIKIRLECDRDLRKARCSQWREDESHPSEIDLDGETGFDLVYDTEMYETDFMVARIIAFMEKGEK